jgi:hypothetical protein
MNKKIIIFSKNDYQYTLSLLLSKHGYDYKSIEKKDKLLKSISPEFPEVIIFEKERINQKELELINQIKYLLIY